MSNDVVIGVDGGGTKTRVAVANLGGCVLGTAEYGGASTEHNDPETAQQNLREGIWSALADANRSLSDVVALTAGIAGVGTGQDYAEAKRLLNIDGLTCEPQVVNDAVIAHIGAFCGDPGVIAVCGTGSVILGITADGDQIQNYDCLHYAGAAAHNLGERALHTILSGEASKSWEFGNRLLGRWDCDSVSDLRVAVQDENRFTNVVSGNPFDNVAPLITAAAVDGDSYAQSICDDALAEVVTGIRIVGGFLDAPVAVATAGSVLQSEYMTAELRQRFTDGEDYRVVGPSMSPVAGAVFDAIDRMESAGDAVAEQLTDHTIGYP
ncbi:BadF/BadG/BcrA/BcrD ATPase family protein [Haladaptatus sp. DYF46]|uniref:BadF/BadG/BcrA/BcrD ATPase family protein n=1 Tax=Haladaptatus sp. DYF46 TaxID=2886041 RepID=UPI001E2F456E|nr:BadF/BadG/BcrA/BcrD ATPase family protein [Haladaptatus sp. DYF46]